MDMDVGSAPDIAPVAPVDVPEAPAAPAEVEAPPKAPEVKDTFAAGTPDARRVAGARDPSDGFDLSNQNPWTKLNGGENPVVQPVLYQGPGIGVPVPREQTHLGITEDEGRA